MTSHVITIGADASLGQAYDLLRSHKISILVVAQEGRAIGLLTERDVVGFIHDNLDVNQTSVASVMTSPVKTVQQDDTLFDAYAILTENHFRHLVVADQHDQLAGVVTLTDMLDGMGMEYFVDLKQVATIMAKKLVRVRRDDSLRLVVDLMYRHRISCVIVVEKWKPVGILTERDIVKYYDQDMPLDDIMVGSVMSSPIRTMSDSSYIPEVNKVMREERIRHMVVVDHHGRLSGLISQTDLTACMDVGYVAYLKGVIEQREQKLSALRHEHDAFLRDNPNAVIALDPSGLITNANPAGLRLMGDDASKLRQKYFLELVHADSSDQATGLFEKACRGMAVHGELMMQPSFGKELLVFNSLVPVKDEDAVRCIYVVMHDVSNEKLAEHRLRQSERRFQALVELSHAMPWVLDLTTGCFTYVGKQFEQYLGYPVDSWINMATWAARMHADDREEALSICAEATEKGEDHQFACRMIANDGRHVPVQTHISVLRQAGQVIELRGFMFLIGDRL